ncbi:hypothetical protein X747_09170 [Mesorhizobium sp. LNJC384A00]|nr:hypothetical protein X766_20385 [Mesorhizobium sp. LSJC255A00]ESX32910.1 hypothetical protein X765_05945 [Mesorhizobium sp. LSHC440B00]ESX40022.1 hypothetical protein X763_02480 [Mesorhizobium sp. LSHC432A00]ESX44909.1 hypothetical protein X764_01475 [Mesorhizobium sp. LSHC440A00]ESX80006.1 hypothetical protein X757_03315 [Mesorhizobium sp. LSHC414A00]ESY28055.1 hypothetical protein X749_19135 [Mesorhizobium sp. LNJC391B00]ESY44110.1 hypothetical protein X747_09170 [Mesorhizobium sp. LNJC3
MTPIGQLASGGLMPPARRAVAEREGERLRLGRLQRRIDAFLGRESDAVIQERLLLGRIGGDPGPVPGRKLPGM